MPLIMHMRGYVRSLATVRVLPYPALLLQQAYHIIEDLATQVQFLEVAYIRFQH